MARLNARELEDFKNRIGRFTSKKVYAFFPILFFFRATFPFFLSSVFLFFFFGFTLFLYSRTVFAKLIYFLAI